MDQPDEDRAAFNAAIGNEYFALQSVRSSSIFEAMGRATMFFTTLTGTLLALSFFAGTTDSVAPVAYAAVPVVAILGLLSFLRLVDISVEDVVALQAMHRIRAYYGTLAPDAPAFFPPPRATQEINALMDTGASRGAWRSTLTVAATVGIVDVLLIGSAVAFAFVDLGAAVTVAVVAGTVAAVLVGTPLQRYQMHRFAAAMGEPRSRAEAS